MMSPFQNPFMLGFDDLEDLLFRVSKGADSFPPYNVEQIDEDLLRMSLAVAGYSEDDLDVTQENNQLVIRGHQEHDESRRFLHRGIAARNFIKSFILADGMKIESAHLDNGLLIIDLKRPKAEKIIRQIPVQQLNKKTKSLNHKS
jgi:HSP20 family molecular chaperone IbpA